MISRNLNMTGNLMNKVIRLECPKEPHELSLREIIYYAFPRSGLSAEVNSFRLRNLPNIIRGLNKIVVARAFGIPHFYGQLYIKKLTPFGNVDYGLVSLRVVTTAGVNFIVDAFQKITELEILKYHGLGTGSTAEAITDTALVTELTTQYNPDNTRATGTTIEGATANVYRTVATNTVDDTVAITEHGILSVATVGSGTLLDRTVFSVVNLVSGEGLQSTYDLTVNAGG